MISYDLAKALKDMGFPDSQFWFDDGKHFYDEEGHPTPPLSELIEACGKAFKELGKHDAGWYAIGDREDENVERSSGYAHSPEEAVARLWLILKKN
jgi:hypothetical protein